MKLRIKNLKVETVIGVHSWEKEQNRDLFINLEIEFDGAKAAETDAIADTLDYDTLSKKLTGATAKSRFDLIEKLARHLLEIVMEDARVKRAEIEISKPGAIENAETVCVVDEIVR